MIEVPVPLSHAAYAVKIAPGLLDRLGDQAQALFPKSKACAVVTDETVGGLYAENALQSLKNSGFQPTLITVPAGETSKCFARLEEIVRGMIRGGLDRKAFLVALGGGVVGDLAGFAAAIHFRGIPYIQVPTTVLAMVDSSVGGKTGINTPEGKNLIGAFHQPKLVLADTSTLTTLAKRTWNEGFAEIIKHAAIRDAGMIPLIQAVQQGTGDLAELIAWNVRIKAAVVVEDEFETKDVRALLNFGHTIGHAVEACAGYGELLHGEAISIGMRAACDLSQAHSTLSSNDAQRILGLLRDFALPLRLPASIPTAAIIEKMARDKKFDQGAIRYVLLSRAGSAYVEKNLTMADLAEAIERLR